MKPTPPPSYSRVAPTNMSAARNALAGPNIATLSVLTTGLALLVALYGDVFFDLLRIAWFDVDYQGNLLIVPISLGLVWLARADLKRLPLTPTLWGLLPLSLGAVAMAVGRAGSIGLLMHGAAVLMLAGVLVAAFGLRAARQFWFPIAFLGLLVPLGAEAVPLLQWVTAEGSVALLRLAGVPTYLNGIWVEMPGTRFVIDEGCAGVRFLVPNLIIAALFCHLSYARVWKWVTFLTVAMALPIAVNIVRTFGVMWLAQATSNEWGVGQDHLVYGAIVYALVTAATLWLGSRFADHRLSDTPMLGSRLTSTASDPISARCDARSALTVALSGLAVILLPTLLLHGQAAAPRPAALAPIPPLAEGWRSAERAKAPRTRHWEPIFPTADRTWHTLWEREQDRVHVFVAWFANQSGDREVVHYANRFDDNWEWKRGELSRTPIDTAATGLSSEARLDRLARGYQNGRHIRYHNRDIVSWYWVDGRLTGSALTAKYWQIQATLSGGRPEAAVFALSAEWRDRPAEARAQIERFLADAAPVGAWLDLHGEPR